MAKPKSKQKQKPARRPGCSVRGIPAATVPEDPRDVALRGVLRQAHELREALRFVFRFYERPRETFGVDDVLRVKAARSLAFGAPPAEEKRQ